MADLLDKAIAKIRELPEDDQERAAVSLLAFAELAKQGTYKLTPEMRVAIAESKAQVLRGEFASDADVETAYARFRA